ncbi:hypothetical protein F120042H4_03060 [Faecalimonas umbilicata]|uniref:hypothetical protein n=1 Tax=Faecalimonas umbilicata TaxID=1912855 RepID=UPI0036F2E188
MRREILKYLERNSKINLQELAVLLGSDEVMIANEIAPLDAVLSTATHFVLKKYKDHGAVLVAKTESERMLVTP